MPYVSLDNCVHSIGGIKDFYIATRDINGDGLNFPLDVILSSGSTNTVVTQFNKNTRILTINNTEIVFRHVFPETCSYREEEVSDRRGKTFLKTLEWTMPKINLTTNNQLKEFIFTADGGFALSSALVFFTDMNDNSWIAGFDLPFVLQDFKIESGAKGEDNVYSLKYTSSSYLRTFQWSVV